MGVQNTFYKNTSEGLLLDKYYLLTWHLTLTDMGGRPSLVCFVLQLNSNSSKCIKFKIWTDFCSVRTFWRPGAANIKCFDFHLCCLEVRNSRVTKSSYEAELHRMTSHFWVTNSEIFIKILFSSYELDFMKYLVKLRVTNLKV